MIDVYLSYNNIISSLGFDSETVMTNLIGGKSGIRKITGSSIFPRDISASMLNDDDITSAFDRLEPQDRYTKLEKMMILSLSKIIKSSKIELTDKTGLIISTTKGNIDVLEKKSPFKGSRAYLGILGQRIQGFFGFKNEAIVLSTACVSGLHSIGVAKNYIQQGVYDQVFIVAGDLVSAFVLHGFNSFHAMSPDPAQPYSINRKGINIGEVAASVLVTSNIESTINESVKILGQASCNDANHISGPSRTGEGLFRAVKGALNQCDSSQSQIDFIVAHGTATEYNDEMESIAFNRLHLEQVPLHSLKGYFGHTLGASGLLETIIGMHCLEKNILLRSEGFDELGVSQPLNVIKSHMDAHLDVFLKTASGFGGSNTAGVFEKLYK